MRVHSTRLLADGQLPRYTWEARCPVASVSPMHTLHAHSVFIADCWSMSSSGLRCQRDVIPPGLTPPLPHNRDELQCLCLCGGPVGATIFSAFVLVTHNYGERTPFSCGATCFFT